MPNDRLNHLEQGRVCELRADGVARCAPRADAGLDTDGGQ